VASPGDRRIVELLARLADALCLVLQLPELDRLSTQAVRLLLEGISQAQQLSGQGLRIFWPVLRDAVFAFLAQVTFSFIPRSTLRPILGFLYGNASYFVNPRTADLDVKRAIRYVMSRADKIVGQLEPAGNGGGEEYGRSRGRGRRLMMAGHGGRRRRPGLIMGGHGGRGGRSPVASGGDSGPAPGPGRGAEPPGPGGPPPGPPGPGSPAPSAREMEKKDEPVTRVVNTGFSDRGSPQAAIPPFQSLRVDTAYWFWVKIGKLQAGSIEVTPIALPDSIPAGAVLTIALFSFKDGLILEEGADIGTVRLTDTGSEVVSQPGVRAYLFTNALTRTNRLLFAVKTPSQLGEHRMRCNIYYRHVLVQSRIVSAWVGPPPAGKRALRSVLDYKLSHSLDPGRLERMGANTLSVFVNENGDGGHSFYFEGEEDVKTQASLDGETLQDSLTQVRKTLRTVAWGFPDPWQKSFQYRYGSGGEPDFFASDLIDMAIRGYMLYSALIDKISGGAEASEKLAALMLKPGRVQIASKESARFVVPAALFYDRPLDTQLKQLRLCDAFLQTVRAGRNLAVSLCFQGACPHLNELNVVCPSGFWGYRHEMGLPVSIEQKSVGEAEPDIEFNDPAGMLVIVSLDKMFVQREPHERELRTSRIPLSFTVCDTRSNALSALKNPQAQMIYFYCHGGITANNTPYLNIGNEEFITPDNLKAYRIRWKTPRPLVFLNGCMTTALEPEKAIEFVSAFVNQAAASGVIGTEITVFEPLATEFAEAFMKRFMGECKPIGLSIKLSRLALLQRFNPLGLVYIPFALPGLRLVDLSGAGH
jgi:hypothetical protein